MADCAIFPVLFYTRAIHRWDEGGHANITRYYRDLLARPAIARVVEEARPYREVFPLPWPADQDALWRRCRRERLEPAVELVRRPFARRTRPAARSRAAYSAPSSSPALKIVAGARPAERRGQRAEPRRDEHLVGEPRPALVAGLDGDGDGEPRAVAMPGDDQPGGVGAELGGVVRRPGGDLGPRARLVHGEDDAAGAHGEGAAQRVGRALVGGEEDGQRGRPARRRGPRDVGGRAAQLQRRVPAMGVVVEHAGNCARRARRRERPIGHDGVARRA